MKMFSSWVIVLLACFASSKNVYADDGGFFLGADLSLSSTDDEIGNENLTSSGLSVNTGYFINRYIGFEAAYSVDSGLINDESFEHKDLSVLGVLPLFSRFDFYVGGGKAWYKGEALTKGQVGLLYRASNHFDLKAGYSFYDSPQNWDDHIESFNVGFVYRFGRSSYIDSQQNVIIDDTFSEPVVAVPAPSQPVVITKAPEVSQQTPVTPVSVQNCLCDQQRNIIKYTVMKDDSLYKIAKKHRMTYKVFTEINETFMNKIVDEDLIYPGDVVNVYEN